MEFCAFKPEGSAVCGKPENHLVHVVRAVNNTTRGHDFQELSEEQMDLWRASDDAFQRMLEAKEEWERAREAQKRFWNALAEYRLAHRKHLTSIGQ